MDSYRCFRCKRRADEIQELASEAGYLGMTPDEYVYEEEGTLNLESGQFACTPCYVAIGMPSAPGSGWKAP